MDSWNLFLKAQFEQNESVIFFFAHQIQAEGFSRFIDHLANCKLIVVFVSCRLNKGFLNGMLPKKLLDGLLGFCFGVKPFLFAEG